MTFDDITKRFYRMRQEPCRFQEKTAKNAPRIFLISERNGTECIAILFGVKTRLQRMHHESFWFPKETAQDEIRIFLVSRGDIGG